MIDKIVICLKIWSIQHVDSIKVYIVKIHTIHHLIGLPLCVISVIQDSVINYSHHVIHEISRPHLPYSWKLILFCQPLPTSPSLLTPGAVLLLFLWVWIFFLICTYKWYHAVFVFSILFILFISFSITHSRFIIDCCSYQDPLF